MDIPKKIVLIENVLDRVPLESLMREQGYIVNTFDTIDDFFRSNWQQNSLPSTVYVGDDVGSEESMVKLFHDLKDQGVAMVLCAQPGSIHGQAQSSGGVTVTKMPDLLTKEIKPIAESVIINAITKAEQRRHSRDGLQ